MRELEILTCSLKRIIAITVSLATLALAGAFSVEDQNDDTAILAATAVLLAQSSGSVATTSAAVCGSKGFCLVFASAQNATVNGGGSSMSFAVHDDTSNASLSVGTQACNNASKVVCVEQ